VEASYGRWVAVVAGAELAGFLSPALVGVATASAPQLVATPALVVAGCVEGLLLGAGQASCLRRSLSGFPTARWVVATTVGAAICWLIGMLPTLTHSWWSEWPLPVAIVAGVLLGTLLLATLGTAQVVALPPSTAGGLGWIVATAGAWCAGLAVFSAVTTPLWHAGQAWWQLLAIGVVGGALMAVTMAAVTGLGMLRLVRRAEAAAGALPGAAARRSVSP